MTESEWPVVRLDELALDEKSAISKPYGSAIIRDDYVASGIPVVRGVNLARWRFHDDDFVFIPQDLADTMPGSRLQPGDLVFTHRGSVGQVSIIPRSPRFARYAVSTSQVKARLDPARAFPEFYFYWFRSPVGRASILQGISTVGVPGLARPVETVKALPVPLPRLDEQRRIAGFLTAVDDLIDADRRHISHVRSLSATLYERLASAAGHLQPLGDVATVSQIKVKPGEGEIRYVDIACMGDGSLEMPSAMDWADAPSRARVGAADGATLWSTVRPNRRAHAMMWRVPGDIVISTGIAVLQPQEIGPAELFAASDRGDFTSQLVAMADGSAYPAVRANQFANVLIPRLASDESARFEQTMAPLWEAAAATSESMTKLARMRDELLPLLMSGKVRVLERSAVA